jgi:hypothetical protein
MTGFDGKSQVTFWMYGVLGVDWELQACKPRYKVE